MSNAINELGILNVDHGVIIEDVVKVRQEVAGHDVVAAVKSKLVIAQQELFNRHLTGG